MNICAITGQPTNNRANVFHADRRINNRDVRVNVRIDVGDGGGPAPVVSDEGLRVALEGAFAAPVVEPAPVEPSVEPAPAKAPKK